MNEGGTPYSPKRLKTTRWGTRAAAWALVAALLIPMLNWARVYAAETPEGGLCVHHPAHTPDCGFVEASLGSPCSLSPDTGLPEDQVYTPGSDALPEHVHDETCGYAPAQEGHPCTYLCPYCVSGWEWNNPEEMLAWNEDAKLWGLGLPGASESMPVTREMLAELLPQSATVSTLDGKKSEQALAWDLSAVPETGAAQGRFSVSASLPEPFVLTSSAPQISVLVAVGGEVVLLAETRKCWDDRPVTNIPTADTQETDKFVSDWSYEIPAGSPNIDNNASEKDENTLLRYFTTLTFQLKDYSQEELSQAIYNALPKRIICTGYANQDLYNAGFTPKTSGSSIIEGYVNIKWDQTKFDAAITAAGSIQNGTTFTIYAEPVSNSGYLLRVNSNDPLYLDTANDRADTAEAWDILNLTIRVQNVKIGRAHV